MDNKISFNPKWLKAAAFIAAHNDIRYYLNGVLVEVLAHEARLVATDGHRMVIFRKSVEGCAPVRLIVPTQIIDMVTVDKKSKIDAEISYNPDNTEKAALDYRGVSIQFSPIDGRYPSYDQIMNKAAKPSGEVRHFDPRFIAELKKCVETAFGANKLYVPSLWHNGNDPAAVTYMGRDDFFGIVMPRLPLESFNPPKWTLPAQEEKKPEEVAPAA